jgi:hypothetical protein
MTRLLAIAALLALSGCSGPILPWYAQQEEAAPVVMEPEPVMVSDEVCPGDGDGIGGTGCETN